MGRIILFDWANVLLDCYNGIYSIHDAQRDIAAHLRPENIYAHTIKGHGRTCRINIARL